MGLSTARILVVDDEPGICQLLCELLTREGYEVESVGSGEDALARLAAADYQMVITDLRMPGMDGFALIEEIRKTRPDVAAIMITAYATIETAVQALRHGADDYVTKPFDNSELKKVVCRTLESQSLARQNKQLAEQLRQANDELSRQKRARSAAGDEPPASPEEAIRRLDRQVQHLRAAMHAAAAIMPILDLDRLLDACLQQINEKLHVQSSSIMLLDEHKTHLVVRAATRAGAVGHRQRVGEHVAGWVAKYKEPLLIDDIRASRHFPPSGFPQYQSQSLISVPLILRGTLLGVLNATDRQALPGEPPPPAQFTDDDVALLTTIAGQMAIAIDNALRHRKLQENILEAVSLLADSIDAREPTSMGHSQRVADHAAQLALALGLDQDVLSTLRSAGRLHDIGNIGICDSILGKPSRLTRQEMRYIQSHSVKGERILQSLGFLDRIRRVVRHHHERWDGSGYPDGLKGEEIPFISRILLLADSWDAITSGRPYRAARPLTEALEELKRGAGKQFDPTMLNVFVQMQENAAAGQHPAAAAAPVRPVPRTGSPSPQRSSKS